MTELYERPSKEVVVNGEEYKIVAFPAMVALDYQYKMGQGVTPELIQEMVLRSCSQYGVAMDKKTFDQKFSGKIPSLMKLFEEVLEFNFTDPLDESDSEE